MSKLFVVGATVLLAVQAIDVDCDASSCPDTCKCSMSECKALAEDCMGDPECAKQHDCAFQCECGDEACLLNCAGMSSSPFATPLMECVQNKCLTNLRSTNVLGVDCEAATCKETCECATNQCASSVDACMADGECSKAHDCAMACPCGSEECLLGCVQQTTSNLAQPVAECISSKCISAQTFLRSTNVLGVDCDAATCKETCECATDKCASSVETCMADGECSKAHDCAMACPCGSEECLLGCVQQTTSDLAQPVAECISSKCISAQTLLGAPNLSCHGSACEDSCKCAKSKCLGKGMTCLLDPHCAGFQDCSFQCACGDAECAMKCAEQQHASAKAVPLAQCITDRCHQERNI